jgi:hypothetical protein
MFLTSVREALPAAMENMNLVLDMQSLSIPMTVAAAVLFSLPSPPSSIAMVWPWEAVVPMPLLRLPPSPPVPFVPKDAPFSQRICGEECPKCAWADAAYWQSGLSPESAEEAAVDRYLEFARLLAVSEDWTYHQVSDTSPIDKDSMAATEAPPSIAFATEAFLKWSSAAPPPPHPPCPPPGVVHLCLPSPRGRPLGWPYA